MAKKVAKRRPRNLKARSLKAKSAARIRGGALPAAEPRTKGFAGKTEIPPCAL
jgi:hypothetical protein